ncbi:hypothetical protein F2Q65_13030 [Thiohalocapsa marina]|uniref:Uncharacterized protein n=1 Tax=Thiohalocapsa marina TaxID=424902 RepID=A0A5M8FH74_9GAMM|nr:hypothetical protein [Thiohalocapsa marina]KAA6184233.1 hypothetical protein F2Q65_13030 [Thiohalocapsa marina]
MSSIRRLLSHAQPGSTGGIAAHIRRGERLAELIGARWGIQRPEQWRAKHLRWALERGLETLSPASRYHYYRTARVIAAALGRWPAWEASLHGPWVSPNGLPSPRPARQRTTGGRPPKLAQFSRDPSTPKAR